jgi:iron complex transport system substrate-binding protein
MICVSRVRLALAALLLGCCASCDSRSPATNVTPPASTAPAAITVASLAPAATDLIVGMGAGGQLVAVSNFDISRPGMPNLPRVGDYQNTDWERLTELRPSLIIVQMDPARMPAGFRDRAAGIGARIVDIQIERLADIENTLDQLGAELHQPALAASARDRLESRLASVHEDIENAAPITTLLCLDENGSAAAAPGTFLDDVLTAAGGKNVLPVGSPHWPGVDKERLVAAEPDVVIELLPGAGPQVLDQANRFWASLPSVPAVAGHRVYYITDAWSLTPGLEMADLAERLARLLHPDAFAATRPGATP